MNIKQDVALEITSVRKEFTKREEKRRLRWPWAAPNPNGQSKGVQKIVALDNVSLGVRRREIFGVLGPNGSGKSTLIRLVCTLVIPDDGSILVFGHDVEREEMTVKRLINRVSVEAAFFKKLSPMENLLFGARLYGMGTKEARRGVFEILERLGLRHNAILQPMEDMSRGMQQKVAVARAFLTKPILLLLDEPTTGLDPRSKREVQEFVLELRDTHDATVLLTTHDMREAETLCDRVAIIDKGRIVAQGTVTELKNQLAWEDGREPTLEDVFMELTGHDLVAVEE